MSEQCPLQVADGHLTDIATWVTAHTSHPLGGENQSRREEGEGEREERIGAGVVGGYWMGGNRREGGGGEVVGSYWMGGNRREGEGRGSGWQLLDGRQEGGGGGVVGSYWMGGSRREGEGEWLAATGWEAVGGRRRGGEVVGSYWMGGSKREGEGRGSG